MRCKAPVPPQREHCKGRATLQRAGQSQQTSTIYFEWVLSMTVSSGQAFLPKTGPLVSLMIS